MAAQVPPTASNPLEKLTAAKIQAHLVKDKTLFTRVSANGTLSHITPTGVKAYLSKPENAGFMYDLNTRLAGMPVPLGYAFQLLGVTDNNALLGVQNYQSNEALRQHVDQMAESYKAVPRTSRTSNMSLAVIEQVFQALGAARGSGKSRAAGSPGAKKRSRTPAEYLAETSVPGGMKNAKGESVAYNVSKWRPDGGSVSTTKPSPNPKSNVYVPGHNIVFANNDESMRNAIEFLVAAGIDRTSAGEAVRSAYSIFVQQRAAQTNTGPKRLPQGSSALTGCVVPQAARTVRSVAGSPAGALPTIGSPTSSTQ